MAKAPRLRLACEIRKILTKQGPGERESLADEGVLHAITNVHITNEERKLRSPAYVLVHENREQ